MPRSVPAYLADILDACDSIACILIDVDLDTYVGTREKRSAVEREFIIIGEAVAALRREAPELVEEISHARLIVGFRNVLTHDYAAIDRRCMNWLARICRTFVGSARVCYQGQTHDGSNITPRTLLLQ